MASSPSIGGLKGEAPVAMRALRNLMGVSPTTMVRGSVKLALPRNTSKPLDCRASGDSGW